MRHLTRIAGLLFGSLLLLGVLSVVRGNSPLSDSHPKVVALVDLSPVLVDPIEASPKPSGLEPPAVSSGALLGSLPAPADGQLEPGALRLPDSSEIDPLPGSRLQPSQVTSSPIPSAGLSASPSQPGRDLRLTVISPPRDVLVGKLALFVHVPPNATAYQPLRVLVALHGVGSNGEAFAKDLIGEADQNHWLLVAPTLPYDNWMDPGKLLDDDLLYGHMLHTELDALPQRLNLKLDQPVLLFGFSRGAQLAHRFAYIHPEHVRAVAALAGGSYTLPYERDQNNSGRAMPLPFGVGDMAKRAGWPIDFLQLGHVRFYIAVGENDKNTADVPRAFDRYVGVTRVERAKKFCEALTAAGLDATLTIFPNAGHEVTSEMRAGALKFLKQNISVPRATIKVQ